jgi:hypothetical protein
MSTSNVPCFERVLSYRWDKPRKNKYKHSPKFSGYTYVYVCVDACVLEHTYRYAHVHAMVAKSFTIKFDIIFGPSNLPQNHVKILHL